MQFNYSGMAKILSWGIPFGLAFALVACDDSSSNPTGGAGGTGGKEESKDEVSINVKSNGCNFKKDDKSWEYSYTVSGLGSGEIRKIYTYKEDGSTDSTVVVSNMGAEAAAHACPATVGDYGEGDYSSVVWCEGGTMYSADVSRNIDEGLTRDEAFEEVMHACQAANGKLSGSDDGDEGEGALPDGKSSSSKGGPADDDDPSMDKSSSSKGGSSEIDEDIPLTNVSCNVNKEDDVWEVAAEEGSATIEWVGGKPILNAKVDMEDAETCEMMLGLMAMDEENESELSCDGKFLVLRDETEFAGYTRDQLYEEIMEGCSNL